MVEVRNRFPGCFRTATVVMGGHSGTSHRAPTSAAAPAIASSKKVKTKSAPVDPVMDASELQGRRVAVDMSAE